MKTKSPSLKQTYPRFNKEVLEPLRIKTQRLKDQLSFLTQLYTEEIDQLERTVNSLEFEMLGQKKKTRKKKQTQPQ